MFLLVGNHDLPHIASRATALEIFRTLTVPNVTVGDTLSTHQIETLGGSLQIISLPWIRRSAFLDSFHAVHVKASPNNSTSKAKNRKMCRFCEIGQLRTKASKKNKIFKEIQNSREFKKIHSLRSEADFQNPYSQCIFSRKAQQYVGLFFYNKLYLSKNQNINTINQI